MVRIKHRYLLVNILYPSEEPSVSKNDSTNNPNVVKFHLPSPPSFTAHLLRKTIIDETRVLFGEHGVSYASHASLQVRYFSQATSTAIVRVHREHWRKVWAAMTMIRQLCAPNKTPCVFQVVRVSGTMRKSEEEAIRRAREQLRRARSEAGGGDVLDVFMGGTDDSGAIVVSEGSESGSEGDDDEGDD